MSSALRLVTPGETAPPAAGATSPGDVASPLRPGDVVRVERAVEAPSGRRVRAGRYPVLRVESGRVVVVRWRPDCAGLGGRFDEPGSPARDETTARLLPGDYTAYDETTDGRHPAYIHDR